MLRGFELSSGQNSEQHSGRSSQAMSVTQETMGVLKDGTEITRFTLGRRRADHDIRRGACVVCVSVVCVVW